MDNSKKKEIMKKAITKKGKDGKGGSVLDSTSGMKNFPSNIMGGVGKGVGDALRSLNTKPSTKIGPQTPSRVPQQPNYGPTGIPGRDAGKGFAKNSSGSFGLKVDKYIIPKKNIPWNNISPKQSSISPDSDAA